MATMTISLPEPMRDFVESEVSSGNYGSASELFRELVRERQKQKTQERLETLLLAGLESGEPIKVNEDYLNSRRKRLLEKFGKENSK
ncbi:MAG: type II toxin-antitoxin system ParD family antitoxin [Pyrinomonadaceae bacterium]|jgi:antitoxin ParD1/3/4|nr:type II toxin-antitoxin system ParD family antitoxin [Pyrinomonadaceae bacterium]